MLNYVSEGRTVPVKIKPSVKEVRSGDPVRVGAFFGVAATAVLANDPRHPFGQDPTEERELELYIQGVFQLKSDASQFTTGDKVYFDPATNQVTAVKPDPNKGDLSTYLIGVATESIKREDGLIRVRLNGIAI